MAQREINRSIQKIHPRGLSAFALCLGSNKPSDACTHARLGHATAMQERCYSHIVIRQRRQKGCACMQTAIASLAGLAQMHAHQRTLCHSAA